ncbi:hypothetical protein NDU88_007148 [Pleurodeles waltl]|uniref:Uncharacterized protein n=1 Tax=Pleurodeles waltl TaxID=8319 RepID=A0AAV7RPG7_PLEWA|nr:hypothetical protein NDU88_007148 [Pleurodeles waltl]
MTSRRLMLRVSRCGVVPDGESSFASMEIVGTEGRQSRSVRKRYQLTALPKIIGLPPWHYFKCWLRRAVSHWLRMCHVVVSCVRGWLFSWAPP